uniref:Uncharacterized protein n=1 Tax=viral metagenome TaxID=1070528 RepID=A0A6M3XYN4_9ZZZZ
MDKVIEEVILPQIEKVNEDIKIVRESFGKFVDDYNRLLIEIIKLKDG